MRNVKDLTRDLDGIFSDLLAGRIKPEIAKELNNTAGKMLKGAQLEMKYKELRKETPQIEFLDTAAKT